MHRSNLTRWLALSAVTMLVVAGCARGSGATTAPTAAPPASAPAVESGAPGASEPAPASQAPAAATCTGSGDKGTVQMMINQWVGAEANVAVVGCLLKQLGYDVKTNTLAEEVIWQGFETGEADVLLENWGHPDLEQKYIREDGLATDLGPMGVQGIIGWYVPTWMVEEYPDITDWQNLNKYADLFKTTESGDKGQFLGADPTFVQFDEALVENLDLNFKVVFSGSEAASITAFQQADKNRTPLIGYFYDPQWLHSQVKLSHVDLPAWTEGCDADPVTIACDYPPYTLNKIVRTAWYEQGGDAQTVVRNFNWSNADQNEVSNSITNGGMSAEEAAKAWIDSHPETWQAWMP